jgi:hypothetical protein
MINNICKRLPLFYQSPRYHFASEGSKFLALVENFFDRAALHTGIRADRLSFYKKC